MARLYSNLDNMMRIVFFTIDEVMSVTVPLVASSFAGATGVLFYGLPCSVLSFYGLTKLKKDGGLFYLKRFLVWHVTGGVQGLKHSPLSSVRIMTG